MRTWETSFSAHLYQELLGFTSEITGAISGVLGCPKPLARSCQTPDIMIPAPKCLEAKQDAVRRLQCHCHLDPTAGVHNYIDQI